MCASPNGKFEVNGDEHVDYYVKELPRMEVAPFQLGDCFNVWATRVKENLKYYPRHFHSYLISALLGDEAFDRVTNANICLDNLDDKTWILLEKVLTDYLPPSSYRLQLQSRVQQPNECVESFVGDLQRLASQAFPNENLELKETVVIQRMLIGLENQMMIEKLYTTRPKTVQRAIRMCALIEKFNQMSSGNDMKQKVLMQTRCFYCLRYGTSARVCRHNTIPTDSADGSSHLPSVSSINHSAKRKRRYRIRRNRLVRNCYYCRTFHSVAQACGHNNTTRRNLLAIQGKVVLENLPTENLSSQQVSRHHMCLVCLEEYKPGDSCVTLPCFHLLHTHCGLEWLSKNRSCPACRCCVYGD